MTLKRTCLGCQGEAMTVVQRKDADPTKPIVSSHWTQEDALASLCPVCLGSGLVDARASRQDALCDAETLQAVTLEGWPNHGHRANTYSLIHGSQEWAHSAIGGALDFADERTMMAGALAFRAVPGLRGEG